MLMRASLGASGVVSALCHLVMLQAVTHLASASAGAIVSAFIRVPTDTLKHRVQAYLLPDIWRVSQPPALKD